MLGMDMAHLEGGFRESVRMQWKTEKLQSVSSDKVVNA